jgi:hypothetical protein
MGFASDSTKQRPYVTRADTLGIAASSSPMEGQISKSKCQMVDALRAVIAVIDEVPDSEPEFF